LPDTVVNFNSSSGALTAAQEAQLLSASNAIAPTTTLEGSVTWDDAMKLVVADGAGDIVDAGAGSYTIKSQDGLKDRMTGTYSGSNRTISSTDTT
jgi:hypothetical protein